MALLLKREPTRPTNLERGLVDPQAAAAGKRERNGAHLRKTDSMKSWLVCVVCMILFCGGSLGARSSNAILFSIAAEFGIPKGQAEWPISIQNICAILVYALAGAVAQKYPLKPMVLTGATMTGLSFVLSAIAPNLSLMSLLFGAIHGSGLALLSVACNSLLTQYFDRYRGLAFGIAHSSSTLASMMFPTLITVIGNQYGFRNAMLPIGIILLSWAPLALLVNDAPWTPKMSNPKELENVPALPWSIFREPMLYILLVPNIASKLCFDTFLETIEDYGSEEGISEDEILLVIDCFSVADVAGRILIPAIADSGLVGRDILLMVCYMLSCLFLLLTCACTTSWHFFATVSILGGFFGLSGSYVSGMVERYLGSKRMPFTFGMMGSIGALVFLFTPVVVGFLKAQLGDYHLIYLSCACLLFVTSLPLLYVIYRRKIGRSLQLPG